MSGVEAVLGIVLGVLPLMITAIQEYETVYRPFSQYRKFEPLKNHFKINLQREQTIFRNECRLLLGSLFDVELYGDIAQEMLADPAHKGWQDEELDRTVAEYLGNSRSDCIEVIGQIRLQLQDIHRTCYSYGMIEKTVPDGPTHSHHFDRGYWVLKAGKVKYSSFSAGLDDQLKELRMLNQSFQTLSRQIIELSSPKFRLTIHSHGEATTRDWHVIQKASKQLYAGLERACECHDEHSLHVRLEPECGQSNHSQIRFTFAFRNGSPDIVQKPTWISVESFLKDTVPREIPLPEPGTLQKDLALKTQKYRHSLHFGRDSHSQAANWTIDSSNSEPEVLYASPIMESHIHELVNICYERNLCTQIQRLALQQKSLLGENCMGYLEVDSDCRNLVYLISQEPCSSTTHCLTLANLMTSSERDSRSGRLTPYEKLRLAKTAIQGISAVPFNATYEAAMGEP